MSYMIYKNILIVIFIIGFFLATIGVIKIYYKCPPNKIIYKYIPRTFEQEQNMPVDLSELYHSMFEQASPWIGSFNTRKKRQEIIGDFISHGFNLQRNVRNLNDDYITQG